MANSENKGGAVDLDNDDDVPDLVENFDEASKDDWLVEQNPCISYPFYYLPSAERI